MSRPPNPIDGTKSVYATFAYVLRWWRESRGLSQDALAKELYMARSTIQAYEAQEYEPDDEFAEKLDKYFGTGKLFYYLWYHSQREYLLQKWDAYLKLEPQCLQFRSFHPNAVPGLFQTEDYMRASFTAGNLPEAEIEKGVETRLRRQELLCRPEPPLFWVVIDEAVLLRPVGGAAAMRAQLAHLLEVMDLPHVALQVVPLSAGAYLGQDGYFVMLHLPERTVVYEETGTDGRLFYDPKVVHERHVRHDRIRLKALPEEATRDLISGIMKGV
ncbi:helix-turn-helix transcriptional regulator [Actinomadura kijaniata]|uniref:Transcriptional regulator with XRE-family HTH domain n=1 Tax=Actinomadura namibiensis TaxID=182080 RepID=A0A7W3LX14_ACTNM|nr:Scr1 family TA system antitoxin-like transcriptional regulator [Actinomadura namibiensis]MBA8955863.1 transcriptional regulator with XRE-family HTH domain [Actinomadura namibiensis]